MCGHTSFVAILLGPIEIVNFYALFPSQKNANIKHTDVNALSTNRKMHIKLEINSQNLISQKEYYVSGVQSGVKKLKCLYTSTCLMVPTYEKCSALKLEFLLKLVMVNCYFAFAGPGSFWTLPDACLH